MAQKAKVVFDKVKEGRGSDPSKGSSSNETVQNTLDTKRLDEILGFKAEISKGVYKYNIGRPDVKLTEHGVPVTTFPVLIPGLLFKVHLRKQLLQVILQCLKARLLM